MSTLLAEIIYGGVDKTVQHMLLYFVLGRASPLIQTEQLEQGLLLAYLHPRKYLVLDPRLLEHQTRSKGDERENRLAVNLR